MKSVNKQIADLIWSHNNPKIKKTTMIGGKREEGLVCLISTNPLKQLGLKDSLLLNAPCGNHRRLSI